jgi:hypothetical protein
LTCSVNGLSPFDLSEHCFAYADTFNVKKLYTDSLFLTSYRKLNEDDKVNEVLDIAIDLIDKSYHAIDVYNDESVLENIEKLQTSMSDFGSYKEEEIFADEKVNMSAAYSVMNTIIMANKLSPLSSKIPAFIKMWSSASHNSMISNMIEEFAKANSIDSNVYVNYHIASNRTLISKNADLKSALLKTISDIYENTMSELEYDYKDSDSIRLYRGNGEIELKSVVSSWSSDEGVAVRFGNVLSFSDVPKSAIIAYNNSYNDEYWSYPLEREFVVMPGLIKNGKMKTYRMSDTDREKAYDKQMSFEYEY